jgi:hypothetical protein
MKLVGRRKARVMRRVFVLGLCFALFALSPTLGGATVITQSYTATGIAFVGSSSDFFDYTQASTATWTAQDDFDAGVYTATNGADIPGSVVLNRIGPTGVVAPTLSVAWWDTAWNNRRCYELDHSDAAAVSVDEYQLALPFPLESLVTDGFLQADFGDLRAVGTDGTTSLPLWVDDTTPDTVWVQVDTIPAGGTSTVCLYFGYNAGTATSPPNHTESSVFSYTTAKDIYYAVSDSYIAPGADVNVVTYSDGNEITRTGGTVLALAAAGDRGLFDAAGTTPGSVFSVLGPISAAGDGDGFDVFVPISFAGTRFVAPNSRDGQEFSFIAPFADATVEIFDGATSAATFVVPAGTPYTHTTADITPGGTAIIESDVPVLVTHSSDVDGDAIALYPATAGDWFTVRSTETLLGYDTDATQVTVVYSDGTATVASGDRGDVTILGPGAAQGGAAGDGLHLTADQTVGVVTQDDGDGNDSVMALPRHELNSSYWLPADSQYIAFACPTEAATPVDITLTPPAGPTEPLTCAGGPTVGWALDATARSVDPARGLSVTSDGGEPFYAYYESTADDQVNLLGMKQGRQYTWPEPVVTPGSDEGLYETSGTWESATFDTGLGTEVYGELGIGGSVPPGSTLRIQVATADAGTPTAFVGPDGTAATYFSIAALPQVLDFSHDGDRLLRVRAELATSDPVDTTPQLDLVTVDHHLARLDRSLAGSPIIAVTTTLDPAVTTSYLLRVRSSDPGIAGSEATAVYRGDTNLANLTEETVRFVNAANGIDSVQQSITTATDPPEPFEPGRPHSVVIDHSALASGVTDIAFAWRLDYQASGSVFFETDFMVEITAP